MTTRKFYTGAGVVRTAAAPATIEVIASTGAVDRMGDTIAPRGWKLANYKLNPVVLWGHDYSSPPVGRGNVWTTDDALHATITFAETPQAQTIYELYRARMLNAVSVGFAPIKWVQNEETGGTDYLEQELLEISCVPIPANQEALVIARKMATAGGGPGEGESYIELEEESYIELAAGPYIELDPEPAPERLRLFQNRIESRPMYRLDPAEVRAVIAAEAGAAIRRHLSRQTGRLR
jgi:HK97 family phage prohead protease